MWDTMGGHRQGIRAEALLAVLGELCTSGKIVHRTRAWRRARIIDEVVNSVLNARTDAKNSENDKAS